MALIMPMSGRALNLAVFRFSAEMEKQSCTMNFHCLRKWKLPSRPRFPFPAGNAQGTHTGRHGPQWNCQILQSCPHAISRPHHIFARRISLFGHKRLDAIFDAVCHSTYTPATRIANLFNVTERTVRSDIAKINSALENNGAYIDIKRGSGYFLVIQNQDLFDDFRSSASAREPVEPELSSSDARIRYLLCDLLCSSDYRSDDELSGTIYVGEKTLQSYIRHIKELLVSYDLALLVKAGTGCKVIGREEDRRRCFMDHVLMRNMRSYVKGFSDEEARLFPSVDLAKLEGIVCNHLELSDIAPTDYGLKNILVHCALMVSRVLAGCPIEGGGCQDELSRRLVP